MKHWKTISAIVILAAVLCLTLWAKEVQRQDTAMREQYGRVTPVSLFNWSAEVDQYKDQLPVVIYFHASKHMTEEAQIMKDYAWWQAKKVKVVSVDLDRPENLLFAARFGVVRHPGFIVVYKDKVVHGYDGAIADEAELKRLVNQALEK